MKRTLLFLTLAGFAAFAPVAHSRAQGDPRAEARLSYLEGKFREAEKLLEDAGADVSGDPDLRAQLADAAEKYLKGKTGDARISGLEAIQTCWAKVAEKKPDDPQALSKAIAAAKELGDLDVAAKRLDQAKNRASWAIVLAEKVGSSNATPDTKAALGDAYGMRASASKRPSTVDAACADFVKGATLLAEAAAGHPKECELLSRAAALRLEQARFVSDTIPIETEKRDDEAIVAAVELATRACVAANAPPAVFDTHLLVLHQARQWKLPTTTHKAFMQPLTPAIPGLSLQVPKGTLWKRSQTEDWPLMFTRLFAGDTHSIQVMLKGWTFQQQFGGKSWQQVADVAQMRFEGQKNEFSEVLHETKPVNLGPKKGPEIWHMQIGGMLASSKTPQRRGEWYWQGKDVTWHLRILDLRRPSEIEDADIVGFVNGAIGGEYWPGGAKEAPEKDPKGKPAKPPKKK